VKKLRKETMAQTVAFRSQVQAILARRRQGRLRAQIIVPDAHVDDLSRDRPRGLALRDRSTPRETTKTKRTLADLSGRQESG
jgi:hypothetical protein